MPKEKTSLNGSSELLAQAIRKVFEETQETTVSLMGDVEKRMGNVEAVVSSLDTDVKGMREQVSGMSKKLDKIQDNQ